MQTVRCLKKNDKEKRKSLEENFVNTKIYTEIFLCKYRKHRAEKSYEISSENRAQLTQCSVNAECRKKLTFLFCRISVALTNQNQENIRQGLNDFRFTSDIE